MKTDHLFALLGRLRDRGHRHLAAELERRGIRGLAPTHGSILNELLKRDAQAMQELAAAIGRDKSTVTTLVDKLAAAGYVIRIKPPEDSRVTRVALTDRGRALGPVFEEISRDLMARAYRGLSEWERSAVVGILEKILDGWE